MTPGVLLCLVAACFWQLFSTLFASRLALVFKNRGSRHAQQGLRIVGLGVGGSQKSSVVSHSPERWSVRTGCRNNCPGLARRVESGLW